MATDGILHFLKDEEYVQLLKDMRTSSRTANELSEALAAPNLSDAERLRLEEAHGAALERRRAAEAAAIKRKWAIAGLNAKLRRRKRKESVYHAQTCVIIRAYLRHIEESNSQ